MSREEQREDSILLQDIAQQINLYDNLFPEVESKELQVLFSLIRIYLARCDNPLLKQKYMMISPQVMKRLTMSYFDPFNTPTSRNLKEALITRLNSIRKYRITKPEVVRRTLVSCLYEEEKKTKSIRKMYLDAFMKYPSMPFADIAKQLGVTPQAVYQAYHALSGSDLMRFYGYINYPKFKLKHYIAFFTLLREYREKGDYLRKLLFDNAPFTYNLNLDIHEGSSWATFAVPNQKDEISRFKRTLTELRGEVFKEVNMVELKSFSTGSNLEFFDGKRWFFDPQLWAYGFFEFVKENKELLRKATELRYSENLVKFDKADFIIASILVSSPFISHSDIAERLRQFGYGVSRPTVTRRVERLTLHRLSGDTGSDDQPSVYRYATYWGLGLSNMSAYLIECSDDLVEELFYAVNYLPFYFLYRTDKGVLLFIKSTLEDSAKVNYMMKGIDEINIIAYSNRFENVGGKSLTPLYEKWNEAEQRWVCSKDELDFVKRYESMP